MFCPNCGREIKSGSEFCGNCGKKLEFTYKPSQNRQPIYDNGIKGTGISKVFGIVSILLLVGLIISYVLTAISKYSGNSDAFYFTSDSAQKVGIVLHWGIMALMVTLCVLIIFHYIKQGMKGEILISYSVPLFICGIILQVCGKIFNDWEFEDMSIVSYRIFGTYKDLGGVTIIISVILFVIGILTAKKNNKKD